MNEEQWRVHVIKSVASAAHGRTHFLDQIAQRLADYEIAAAALRHAGYGDAAHDLLTLVAEVIHSYRAKSGMPPM